MIRRDRKGRELDAYHYWEQFHANVTFDEPTEISGLVVELLEERSGTRPVPRLKIQTKDGIVYVIAGQARLIAALKREKPVVGDRIRITYHGEAEKAAPGMSRAKLFTVEVWRPEDVRAEGRTGKEQETPGPENDPQPGQPAP